ncbi:hypothetical protein M1N21_00245 [Dehalococcoidia bacterium]|nr:hypothetical protein [Dehalococcoidia bacterium]
MRRKTPTIGEVVSGFFGLLPSLKDKELKVKAAAALPSFLTPDHTPARLLASLPRGRVFIKGIKVPGGELDRSVSKIEVEVTYYEVKRRINSFLESGPRTRKPKVARLALVRSRKKWRVKAISWDNAT